MSAPPPVRIIGVDPGLASTGVGVIEVRGGQCRALDWGKTTTSPAMPLPDRLAKIFDLVDAAIRKHQPEVLAIESLFFAKNVRSTVLMAHGRGAALLAAAKLGIAVREYSPREVKLAVAGSGRATKEQILRLGAIHLGLKELPKSDHESDALAIALCAALREYALAKPNLPPLERTKKTKRIATANESLDDPRKALLAASMNRRRKRR